MHILEAFYFCEPVKMFQDLSKMYVDFMSILKLSIRFGNIFDWFTKKPLICSHYNIEKLTISNICDSINFSLILILSQIFDIVNFSIIKYAHIRCFYFCEPVKIFPDLMLNFRMDIKVNIHIWQVKEHFDWFTKKSLSYVHIIL